MRTSAGAVATATGNAADGATDEAQDNESLVDFDGCPLLCPGHGSSNERSSIEDLLGDGVSNATAATAGALPDSVALRRHAAAFNPLLLSSRFAALHEEEEEQQQQQEAEEKEEPPGSPRGRGQAEEASVAPAARDVTDSAIAVLLLQQQQQQHEEEDNTGEEEVVAATAADLLSRWITFPRVPIGMPALLTTAASAATSPDGYRSCGGGGGGGGGTAAAATAAVAHGSQGHGRRGAGEGRGAEAVAAATSTLPTTTSSGNGGGGGSSSTLDGGVNGNGARGRYGADAAAKSRRYSIALSSLSSRDGRLSCRPSTPQLSPPAQPQQQQQQQRALRDQTGWPPAQSLRGATREASGVGTAPTTGRSEADYQRLRQLAMAEVRRSRVGVLGPTRPAHGSN